MSIVGTVGGNECDKGGLAAILVILLSRMKQKTVSQSPPPPSVFNLCFQFHTHLYKRKRNSDYKSGR